jgi:hypothetical protein
MKGTIMSFFLSRQFHRQLVVIVAANESHSVRRSSLRGAGGLGGGMAFRRAINVEFFRAG